MKPTNHPPSPGKSNPKTASSRALAEANEALLPPLYARWVSGLLDRPIPNESLATCSDCAMCSGNNAVRGAAIDYFNPTVKCCTYTPALPNFLVGGVLSNPATDPTGRQSLVERLNRRVRVSPLGIHVPQDYVLRYDSMAPGAFGRAAAMRCPHYLDRDGGLCGIWRNRNAICSTWFCKMLRGGLGFAFWESLRELLSEVEKALSVWAAGQVGVTTATLRQALLEHQGEKPQMTEHDLSGTVDQASYAKSWGVWLGREAEYFEACAEAVRLLEWSDVERIAGATLQAHAQVTREAFAKMMRRELPPTLEVGRFQIISKGPGGLYVSGYNPNDPVEMSPLLLRILPYFDGSATEEILARVAQKERVQVDRDLLIRLADYGIIKAGNPPGPSQ